MVKTTRLTGRDWIYVALIFFISGGVFVDTAIWPYGPPSSLTANDVVQMLGIVILFAWWQIEDAERHGYRRSSVVRLFSILVAPLGLAIYFYQTRPWKKATVGFLAFMGGIVIFGSVAILLSEWLLL